LSGALRRRALIPWRGKASGGSLIVARILGNDLPPRHAPGESLRSLTRILRTEGEAEGVRPLFLLNRLHDPATAMAMTQEIAARGHEVVNLPFDPDLYARAPLDWAAFGPDPKTALSRIQGMAPAQADRARLWALRHKLAAAVGLNEARNLALDLGRARADWTLVLDGGCLIPPEALAALRQDLAGPFAPALILPMRRVEGGDPARATAEDLREEPQVAFHRSARSRFDPRFPYGLRDKSSLLVALGVPGPWDGWGADSFLPRPEPSPDRHAYRRATAPVLRLGPETPTAQPRRYADRNAAIFARIIDLDERTQAADALLTRQLLDAQG
jgi:hypothetical protein